MPALAHVFVSEISQSTPWGSRLTTVIMCAVTSNLRRAEAPGNVLLPEGEGNLATASVVNVTQLFTIDTGELTERIGRLGTHGVVEVLRGIRLVLDPRRIDPAR